MKSNKAAPSNFWAFVATTIGAVLVLAGAATTITFLGLPFLGRGMDLLGPQLGQMAGIFVGLGCGALLFLHGLGAILKRRSSPLRLPPMNLLLIILAVVLGLGNLMLNFEIAPEFLFPPIFFLGAALPTVGVIAWAFRRLGWPITWRQGALAFAAGSTLSIGLAMVLETILPAISYMLLFPLEAIAYSLGDIFDSGSAGPLKRLMSTPQIAVFLLFTAFQAPIPEEFAKYISVTIFGRVRVDSERKAFALGLAAGAGFAVLENMLYEGLYAGWSGWSWGGITLLRAVGSALHPLCTAIVAAGWYRARREGWGTFFRSYLLAVGFHTLWNGGFMPFAYLTGLEYLSGVEATFSIYGLAVQILLAIFLLALSTFLWWYLRRAVLNLAQEVRAEIGAPAVSYRTLAAWGLVCLMIILPIGAALGPAWKDIRAILFAG